MNPLQPALAVGAPVLPDIRPAEGLPVDQPSSCRLEQVWRGSHERLTRLALGLGLRADQAADALQDVYLLALQRPPPIDDAEQLRRWLVRVTLNRCQLEHRRRGRWQRLWSAVARTWQGWEHRADAVAIRGELRSDVDRALASLEADDRALVVLSYLVGLNSRELSEILEIPEATIRGRLRAARRKLAGPLAEWNDHE